MEIDPLSDVLRLVKAEAVVTGGFSAGGPWAIRFPPAGKIKFFAVVRGACRAWFDGEPEAVTFGPGDVGLLTEQKPFVLASDAGVPPVEAMTLFGPAPRNLATIGDGGDFDYFGGHVLFDPAHAALLATVLPPWIHVRAAAPEATAFRALLAQLVEERTGQRPGAQLATAQLTQLLFIQILRAHLKAAGPMPAGWLRAAADPRLAPALRLMHGDPGRAWGLDTLARACGMSRTMFAAHFRSSAGIPPLTYLTEWRMRLAREALRERRDPLATIARALGYASESAFSNAFKRVTGQAPTAYRAAPSPPRSA